MASAMAAFTSNKSFHQRLQPQKPLPLVSSRISLSARRRRTLLSCADIRAETSTGAPREASSEKEKTKHCLQNLAETLVLPSGFLSKLPDDLKVDLNDAAFALSNGPLNQECGERVAEVIMGLSRAWEQSDTQTAAALASKVPSLQDLLPSDPLSSAALGNRLKAAGRYLASTGQYGDGELQKLSKALLAAGEALSLSNANPPDKPPPDNTRSFKFGDLQVQLTAQDAYTGAAIAFAFGLLSWGLTSALQNIVPNSTQYANDSSFIVATSLRGTLLTAGYFCSSLSALIMVGLVALAKQLGREDTS